MLYMEKLTKLYDKCPVWLQNLMISVYGAVLYIRQYGKTYQKYLKLYQKRDQMPFKIKKKRQNADFLKLLQYAVTYSPYYKELYKEIDIEKIKSLHDIGILPIVTKEAFHNNINDIYTFPTKNYFGMQNGKASGIPLIIRKRKKDIQKRMAYLDYYKMEYGFHNLKMRSAGFFSNHIVSEKPNNHIYWRNNYIFKQRYYSTHHLEAENITYYVNDLNKFKPAALEGLILAIYTIAKYIDDHKITLEFKPLAVFTAEDTILPMHRKMIEKVFECPLSNQYPSMEGAPLIRQCAYGSYHENIDTGVFEHIQTPTGIKLVVTSFDSYGTPLIRYDTGDYIMEDDTRKCKCGSYHPVIGGFGEKSRDDLTPRSKDKLRVVNMSISMSELQGCFENIQLIHNNENDIEVKIVVLDPYCQQDYKEMILDKVKSSVGEEMDYHVEKVDYVMNENSGKYRMIDN